MKSRIVIGNNLQQYGDTLIGDHLQVIDEEDEPEKERPKRLSKKQHHFLVEGRKILKRMRRDRNKHRHTKRG